MERKKSEESIVTAFNKWLSNKRDSRRKEYDDEVWQHELEHNYSLSVARERTARAKDVGRHFIENHERFTTVLVTYSAKRRSSESIAEHASKYYSSTLSKERWKVFNQTIDTDEWAGVRLLAPGKPAENTPNPDFTHGHSIYWVEGWHERGAFEPLRETFLEEVDGATPEENPIEDMVKVRHHTSAEIETHPLVKREDLDEERGAATAASGEVSANLPLLRARNLLREQSAPPEEWAAADASDCPGWIEKWCANLFHGLDGNVDTGGISRYGELGSFKPIADSMKDDRGYCDDEKTNQNSDNVKTDSGGQEYLSDKEHEFVEAYIESGAPTDRQTIEKNINDNLDEFGAAGVNVENVVEAIKQSTH